MNKFILLGFISCLSIVGLSQRGGEQPQNVSVQWKVGDIKTVTQYDSTKIYQEGGLTRTGSRAVYWIDVYSQIDTVYEVQFRQLILDEEILIESEIMDLTPLETLIREIMMELQDDLSRLQYNFLVDQNTGLAFKIKNEGELVETMEKVALDVIDELLDKSMIELSMYELAELEWRLEQWLDEQRPALMQSTMNAFNYVFQAYSTPFLPSGSFSYDAELYQVDQLNFAGLTLSARQVVTSKIQGKDLILETTTFYDKDETYQKMVVDGGYAEDIAMSEFNMDSRVVSVFDSNSSWIKSSYSVDEVVMGNIRVESISLVTFK